MLCFVKKTLDGMTSFINIVAFLRISVNGRPGIRNKAVLSNLEKIQESS